MMTVFRSRIVLLLGALVLFPVESPAQQLSLSGTVRDTSGVVPGATVILSSGANRLSTATTDAAGVYRFSGLAPGSYELSVMMRGFETAVRNVTLGPATAPVDVMLSVGRVSTTLTVTASAGKATATRLPVANDDVPAQVSSIPQELLRQQELYKTGASAAQDLDRARDAELTHDVRLLGNGCVHLACLDGGDRIWRAIDANNCDFVA